MPSLSTWGPLLLVNLWQDSPVSSIAEYVVEPHRNVDRVYSSIPSTYVGPDDEYEIPQLGPARVEDTATPQMTRFLKELQGAFHRWLLIAGGSRKSRRPYERLQRSGMRFLEASEKVAFDTDVLFAEDRPHVVFSYVSALENLLSGEDEESGDLRRRTAQRAAVLIGRDEEHRKGIYGEVSEAYGVRNKIAHGAELHSDKLAAAVELRPILRRALIAAIILGPGQELSTLCDEALLSHTALHEKIQIPLNEFRSAVSAT